MSPCRVKVGGVDANDEDARDTGSITEMIPRTTHNFSKQRLDLNSVAIIEWNLSIME